MPWNLSLKSWPAGQRWRCFYRYVSVKRREFYIKLFETGTPMNLFGITGRRERKARHMDREVSLFCSVYWVMAVFPARIHVSSQMTGCHITSVSSQHLNCSAYVFCLLWHGCLTFMCFRSNWIWLITSHQQVTNMFQATGVIAEVKWIFIRLSNTRVLFCLPSQYASTVDKT